jgi:hypothetical protein
VPLYKEGSRKQKSTTSPEEQMMLCDSANFEISDTLRGYYSMRQRKMQVFLWWIPEITKDIQKELT